MSSDTENPWSETCPKREGWYWVADPSGEPWLIQPAWIYQHSNGPMLVNGWRFGPNGYVDADIAAKNGMLFGERLAEPRPPPDPPSDYDGIS